SPVPANLSAARSGGKFGDNSLHMHGDAGLMLRRGNLFLPHWPPTSVIGEGGWREERAGASYYGMLILWSQTFAADCTTHRFGHDFITTNVPSLRNAKP